MQTSKVWLRFTIATFQLLVVHFLMHQSLRIESSWAAKHAVFAEQPDNIRLLWLASGRCFWQVLFDYDVDSDDDWEEEEPGESLSDCEKKDDDDEEVWNTPNILKIS